MIMDRVTNLCAGYSFVHFYESRCADLALHQLNGKTLLGQEISIHKALPEDTCKGNPSSAQIFVGDLSQEVTDQALFKAFQVGSEVVEKCLCT